MVLVFYMSSYVALHFLKSFKKISETIFKLKKGNMYMTRTPIYNVQRVLTPKAGYSELWFLCSAHHIVVIYICVKFQENISNSFQVTEQTYILEITIFNIQGP